MIKNSAAVVLILALLSGCTPAQLDRSDASSLSTAGQAATQALQGQVIQAKTALALLPTVISVKEILDCRGIDARKSSDLRASCVERARSAGSSFEAQRQKLLDILAKRQQALQALGDAYNALGDLATYDAGQAAANAVDKAFGKINELTASLTPILPAGVAMAPISATVSKVLAGATAFSADQRQAALILATSKDLHTAVDAMIRVLQAEEDSAAMKSLLVELQDERMRLERSSLAAGLATPTGVLADFFAKVAPDISLAAASPPANADLVTASADVVLSSATAGRTDAIRTAYDQAISALASVSSEHQKLESRRGVDVSIIAAEVKHLRDVTGNLGK